MSIILFKARSYHYLGIEVDDAIEIAEKVDVGTIEQSLRALLN